LKNLKKLGEMQEIGLQLKKQREAKGLGLADIEKITKISIRLLRSIEAGDFGALPSGVFARNFVRQYCKAVGLSPEPILEKVFVVDPDLVESEDGPEEKSRRGLFIFVVAVILVACVFWRYQGRGCGICFQPGPNMTSRPYLPRRHLLKRPQNRQKTKRAR